MEAAVVIQEDKTRCNDMSEYGDDHRLHLKRDNWHKIAKISNDQKKKN